ncbi:MAG: UbiH/UbiF family hydroxylase [Methylophilaceae bacterium]|nr:UbiH/UbiF family hydroxylase [Methylophilaceae bacterium]
MNDLDVVVVGGGLVGSALTLALAQAGLRLALVEPSPCAPLPGDASWDARIYAISPGNAEFLRQLGVWDGLDASRIAPIHAMHVWGDDGVSRLDFEAYDAGVPELGFIAESRLIQNGLWQALKSRTDVTIVSQSGTALTLERDWARLDLEDGCSLRARLLVGADGGGSWVRQQAGIEVHTLSYGQLGIVANFEAERPHGNIARQWFLRDGILAWLPLPGNRISIVWSAFEAEAQALLALGEAAFCRAVEEAGHGVLGTLRQITPPMAFPLRLQHNTAVVAPRLALVGDAAHMVHPLAGQGVNLGFRDAKVLAETLMARGLRELGDLLLLRRYERARKADVVAMQVTTTGLQKLFNNPHPVWGWLRNRGLAVVHRLHPLKRQLMVHALA